MPVIQVSLFDLHITVYQFTISQYTRLPWTEFEARKMGSLLQIAIREAEKGYPKLGKWKYTGEDDLDLETLTKKKNELPRSIKSRK